MPTDFDRCVEQGGKVRTISGPSKKHGLSKGEYVRYCSLDGKTHRGEVKQKKHSNEGQNETKMHRRYVQLKAVRDGELEVKQLNGADHLVVPSIILVEGVLHASNAEHPALALAEEFGIFPSSWDGRPVVYSHPKRNGEAVSANSPDLWESEVIGQLFGSGMKDKKKLRTYVWLNKERTPDEVLQAFENGEAMEVSTGLYALEEEKPGEFDGRSYDVIWRNIVPDHLAILPKGSTGACSIDDGCGAPRANQNHQIEQTQHIDARSTKESLMPTSTAQPGTASPKASSSCDVCDQPTEQKTFASMLRSQGKKILESFLNVIGVKHNELSDVDKRVAVETALNSIHEEGWCYVVALFSDKVIYAHMDANYAWKMYQRGYVVVEGGGITISSDVTEVRSETQYVPLTVTANESDPATTPKETLMDPNKQSNPAETPATPASPTQASAAPAEAPAKAKTLDELMEMADSGTKEQLKSIMQNNIDRGNALTRALSGKTGLSDDELKKMDLQQLERMAKSLIPSGVDFSGAGGGQVKTNADRPEGSAKIEYTPVTPLFPEVKPGEKQVA